MPALPHELHLARFTASPDDRVSFDYLEEHLFMQGDWPALADLYRRRQAAPSLVAESLGDPVAAFPHLRRCLELEPTRADLLERALVACELRGGPLAQLDLIEHACDRAESDAARAALLARRGTLLADALRWQAEAKASWRAALAIDPNLALTRERVAGPSA